MAILAKTVGMTGLAASVVMMAQSPASAPKALTPVPVCHSQVEEGQIDGEIFREIRDPNSGERWLLASDVNHRGGPGRLVLEAKGAGSDCAGNRRVPTPAKAPVIHAGDALIVEEHSTIAEAHLEAVALEPAARGAEFKARLKIGGKVVHVVALDRGRSAIAPESEIEP